MGQAFYIISFIKSVICQRGVIGNTIVLFKVLNREFSIIGLMPVNAFISPFHSDITH